MILFSQTSNIQSATVHIAVISIVSSMYFLTSFLSKNSTANADISLNATQAPERCLNGYEQSPLLGLISAIASSGIISGTL
jgi:hypothetical protein